MSIIRKEQLSNPLSASYAATASIATSASFATTASFALNVGTSINTGSFVTTSSFNAFTASINSFTSSINAFTASYNTGSFTGSFTGSLLGTSSWAVSASQALSSSFYQETDPIFVAKSASLATTGSNNFNGNQTITGSLSQGLAGNIATGEYSHAEGSITKAIGDYSHAEGDNTQATGNYSHAEGQNTMTLASAQYSHAEGNNTIAAANHQHVQGQWNVTSSIPAAFIVGNGTDDGNRSNLIYAHDSIVEITGSLEVNGGITGSLFGTASWAINALTASYIDPTFISASAAAFGFGTDTGSLLVTASLSSSILVFEKGDTTTFNVPFNDFDFSLNFISAVSYSIILPYSYSIDTIDNPSALTVIISSSGDGYTTGSIINPFATTVVEVDTTGFINLNCIKLE